MTQRSDAYEALANLLYMLVVFSKEQIEITLPRSHNQIMKQSTCCMANSVDPDQDPCCLQGNLNVSSEVRIYFFDTIYSLQVCYISNMAYNWGGGID